MKRWLIVFILCAIASLGRASTYQTFEENGKVGLKDGAGNVVLPPSFEALGWSDGNFSVIGETTGYRIQGLWGIINLKKEFVTKAEFESLTYAGGDCLIARKKINAVMTKTGCIDLHGVIKIPLHYDGVMVHGLRAIVFNLKGPRYYYGLVDMSHRIVLPVEYKYIRPLGTLRYAVENREGKIALYTEEGKPITTFSIDSISAFYKNYAVLYQDQMEGLIDRDGMMKLEIKYSKIVIQADGSVKVLLPTSWAFINSKNETVHQIFADDLFPDGENFIVRKGKIWGTVDKNLQPLLPLRYQKLSPIGNGKYLVSIGEKMGVVNKDSKILIDADFDSLEHASNTFRSFTKSSGWQLLDESGKVISSRYYQEMTPAKTHGYVVKSRDFFGWMNDRGVEQIHCVFDSLSAPVEEKAAVKFKGKYGIIDNHENWIVPPQQYQVQVINKEVYLQREPGNNFVKSFLGNIIYFTPYRLAFGAEVFSEFLPDGTVRTMNYLGQLIPPLPVPENVKEVFTESEGYRGIKKDDRYGFVDRKGKLRIANRYDSIGEFHEGLAAVKLIGRWGFVNSSDQITINPNYDRCAYFKNGLAIVSRNNKFGLINQSGQPVLALRYDKITRLPDNKFLLEVASRLGLADAQGALLVEPRFNSLKLLGASTLLVSQDGKFGVISEQGLSIIPMLYDQLMYDEGHQLFLGKTNSYWKEAEMK
ncbi:MAG: WG repeat-containing protein [Bacteroidetes bacterium]|nr:WG repeat-containing protein [Bacteroidota bacterium]